MAWMEPKRLLTPTTSSTGSTAPPPSSWRPGVGGPAPEPAIVGGGLLVDRRSGWQHGPMADLVISGGTVVDGTGAPPFEADVVVSGGRIVDVGPAGEPSRPAKAEVIDARNLLVTPGWVDIHTHYDGQLTWDPELTPSSWHGVTTVVTGNCGVGFAPCRPSDRQWLVELMEGVEDIPGTALAEG